MKNSLKVIDFFCGAGGFSEGFRQQGFEIVMGIDNWGLAIETHNLNHGLKDTPKDVLVFGSSMEEIHALPDTEVIVGSPPCVLFSLSNKGGKADKTLGIQLIESFLRVVAVKKHQPGSRLKAWFMENVPNSKNYILPSYTFDQLNLTEWAQAQRLNPNSIALKGSENGQVINTADFGTSQKRERFVCGEIIASGLFPDLKDFIVKQPRSIGEIRRKMPLPNIERSKKTFTDPNYPSLKFAAEDITDHFYDSGVYECQWKNARELKKNHPYMGKMAFPEDADKPSRTIMATRSASTREALIYKSEHDRKGDGEYRLPTIREIATLMGFPYSYQFSGGECNKWRQIGNAVCPHMSAALAKSVRLSMGLQIIPEIKISFKILQNLPSQIVNLNTFSKAGFDKPPKKHPKAKFRRHPFKDGNMTVALTNFDPKSLDDPSTRKVEWFSSVFLGAGKDFKVEVLPKSKFKWLAKHIETHDRIRGKRFLSEFDERFQNSLGKTHKFQDAYVGSSDQKVFEPSLLVEEIGQFISQNEPQEKFMVIPNFIPGKDRIPVRQVLAMYAINRIVS